MPDAGGPAATPPGLAIIIAGPTGCGKSALALDLAEAFGGEIVNADSMQVYRELRVLTARPTAADEARAPHHLYGFIPAAEACSAGRWTAAAAETLAAIGERRRLALVTGGTGLYIRSLLAGLAPVPPIPDDVREATRDRFRRLGGRAFRDELAAVDPEAAARLPASDRQRLMRAREVFEATGKPLSAWQREAQPAPLAGAPVATLALVPDRQPLYAALEARFDAMLAAGALEEAAALLARGLPETLPAMKAVGAKQLMAHLRGSLTLNDAITLAKRDTRRYAKRQMTWIRHQFAADLVIDAQYSESVRAKIFTFIRRFLLTLPA